MRPRGWSKNTKIGFTAFLSLLLLMPWITLTGDSLSEAPSRFRSSRYRSTDPNSVGKFSFNARISASYESNPLVHIRNNSDFMAQAISGNWSGYGTSAAPYVIEGLKITGPLNTALISIRDTDVFFRIINCWLEGGEYGIRFVNITNGEIFGNTVTNTRWEGISLLRSESTVISDNNLANQSGEGISLWESGSSTITNNTVTDSGGEGISLVRSEGSTITNNTVTNNGGAGIALTSSGNNRISDNILLNNGLAISGLDLEDYVQIDVTNNSVNGKPVIYWQHLTGGSVPNSAAQIILVNCTAVTVTGQTLSHTSTGVLAAFSSDLMIHDNHIFNNSEMGIALEFSKNITIFSNTVTNNGGDGISLEFSTKSTISDNTIINHTRDGIYVWKSNSDTIIGNIVTDNGGDGISLEFSWDNPISGNTITNNNQWGIYLFSSIDNIVSWNDFIGNNINGFSQAYDGGQNNEFTSNYWNEWTDPDTDQDGIVDTPYLIAGPANNQDDFPRTSPMQSPIDWPIEHIISSFILVLIVLVTLGFSIRRQRRRYEMSIRFVLGHLILIYCIYSVISSLNSNASGVRL